MHSNPTLKLPTARRLQPTIPQDRLPLRLAGPVLLALSVLCWLGVWALVRIVF